MPKKVCANGFWLFAQCEKQKRGFSGPFGDFVPLAELIWEELSIEKKVTWKATAKNMKKTLIFRNFDTIDRAIKKGFYTSQPERTKLFKNEKYCWRIL